MKIIFLSILILILLLLIIYKNKERFSNLNILKYPDPDIENQELWIKEHVNDTITKKKQIYKFLGLLGKQINNIFYSSEFSTVIQNHNNQNFDDKVPFIIEYLSNKFVEIRDNNNNKRDYKAFSSEINSELIQVLIDYLTCNLNALSNVASITCSKFIEENKSKLYFDKSQVKDYDLATDIHLIHKFFTNRDLTSLTNIFKEKLLKYYVFENEEYKSQDYIPCVIYDKQSCPDGGANSKCQVVNGQCVPKANDNKNVNNNPINDCNTISLYGADLCNLTTNKNLQSCVWNNNTQKCMNPNEDSTNISCEDLRGPNLEEKCENLNDESGNPKCDYFSKTKTNTDGNTFKHEFCYDKTKKNNMNCLNLSGIYQQENTDDAKILENYNCSSHNIGGVEYFHDPNLISKEKLYNLDCGIFDNSSYLRDKNNAYFIKKDKDNTYLGNDIELQKSLCENNKEDKSPTSLSKCNFIKYNNYANKTITKCMPKEVFVSSNFVEDENTCRFLGYDYIGNEKERKCLDISAKCNDIKYKNLCDLRDNKCIWVKGLSELSNNSKDLVERGYCINNDTSELDNLIDDYHNEEIMKIAKFRNLSNELQKINTNDQILKKLQQKIN